MTLAEGTLARTRCSACSIARATSGDDNPGSNSTSFRDQRARREVEWASVRGSTTIPHRRSLTGGAHPSSRLARMTLPSRPGDEPHHRRLRASAVGPATGSDGYPVTHGLPHVRSHPVDG